MLVNGEGAKRVCCWDWFDFTQIKETLSTLDKQHPVETNIYTCIKEASFKGIADKPMLFTALSRLLVNYESEWYSEIDAEGNCRNEKRETAR